MANDSRTLEIDVSLDTGQLRRGTKAAEKELSSIGKTAKSLGPLIAGAFGTAALTNFVSKSLEANDVLAKTADRLGVSTQAMAGFNLAAKLSGQSVEQVSTSLQIMNRNVSDAANGLGTAKDAIAALGLDAQKLRQSGPEEAFLSIVGALEGVENAADRSSFAMDIFGRSGGQVLNMTADGIRQAKQEAIEFGTAISRDQAAGIEAFNDTLTRLQEQVDGAATSFTLQLLPALNVIADALGEEGDGLGYALDAVVFAFESLTIGALSAKYVIDQTGEAIGATAAAISLAAQGEFQLAREALSSYVDSAESDLERLNQQIQNIGLFGGGAVPQANGTPQAAQPAVENTEPNTEALQAQLDAEFELKVFAAERENEWRMFNEEQRLVFLKRIKDEEAQAEEDLAARKLKAQQGAMQALAALTSLADSKSRKAFEISKAAAIAETTVNTYKSATAAYSGMTAAIPGPVGIVLGIAAAAASVAAGVKNVQKIKSTKFGGAGSAGGAATPTVPAEGGAGANFGTSAIAQPQQNIPQQPPTPQVKVISNNTLIGKIVEEEVIPAINDSLRRGNTLDLEFA